MEEVMKNVKTQEYFLATPYGEIYAKKWLPIKPSTDIPLILFHDSLGSVALWRDFPEVLAMKLGRIIIAYDRLGFGKSAARNSLPNIEFIAEEATLFFPLIKKALSITKYLVIGHSVGGAMAINIAAVDKDCLAVITEAAQAFVEDITLAGIVESKKAFQQLGQMERLEKWHGSKAKWVLSAWIDVWLSPEFSNWCLAPGIKEVTCPTLVIHGDSDPYGSRAFPEFITNNVSGKSEMLIFANCGHIPHKEFPDELMTKVVLFLKQHDIS